MLVVQARAPGASGYSVGGRSIVEPAHVIRTPRAAVTRPKRERVITSQRWTLQLPAVEFTVQTFARLTLVNPLLPAAERHMLQLLVLTGLFGIALRTAQVTSAAPPPGRTVARWFHAADDSLGAGAHLTGLIPGRDLPTVRNLTVLEHTT